MSELQLPWLQLSILLPSLGAVCVARLKNAESARRCGMIFGVLTLACASGAYVNFLALDDPETTDPWNLTRHLTGRNWIVIDRFSAPLLPLAALLHLLTAMATLGAKVRRLSIGRKLVSEAILLATLSSKAPWFIISLLAAETVLPYLELKARNRSRRVFAFHMAPFVGLLVAGQALLNIPISQSTGTYGAAMLLLAAVFVRSGIAPAHCWMTDLFDHTGFATALLFVLPLTGAYAAVRLVLPIAPEGVLRILGLLPLFTSVYAAGMALVQRDSRRFFCFIFLSHSSLVLVGLLSATPIGLTGALCAWLSVGLALGGFGLSLRALEARHRRLSLTSFHGLYEHTPTLAGCFLLTGLACVGFPGTFGFLSNELLVEGVVKTYPYVGITMVLAAALSGVAIVRAYFRLFTGTRHVSTVPLRMDQRERFALSALSALILLGGLFPQPGITSRHAAASQIIEERRPTIPHAAIMPHMELELDGPQR